MHQEHTPRKKSNIPTIEVIDLDQVPADSFETPENVSLDDPEDDSFDDPEDTYTEEDRPEKKRGFAHRMIWHIAFVLILALYTYSLFLPFPEISLPRLIPLH